MTPEFPTENFSSPTNVSKSVTNASWPRPQHLWHKWQIGNRTVVSQAVSIKITLFQQRSDKSMFETLRDETWLQRFINNISNYWSNLFQTVMEHRGWNWIEVTRFFFFFHFLEYCFHAFISCRLKFCKESPRGLNSVSGDWPVSVKAASNLFNLTNKKLTKLIRKRLWGNHYWDGKTPGNYHSLQFCSQT